MDDACGHHAVEVKFSTACHHSPVSGTYLTHLMAIVEKIPALQGFIRARSNISHTEFAML